MYLYRYIFKACNSKSQLSFISYVSGYDIYLSAMGNQYFFRSTTKHA